MKSSLSVLGILKMRKASKFLSRFWGDDRGSIGSEYGALMVVIAFGMAVAAGLLGVTISNAITNAASCVNTPTQC